MREKVGRMQRKNAAENYKKKFFGWIKIWKNDVNSQEMLCNKIFENPQIFVFIIFSGIPCWLRSMQKKFGFGFWATLARIVDEIENSKSKIIY